MLATLLNPFATAAFIGCKAIRYFFDSTIRDKVSPVPGSVLYCDLWVAVEHSGIYLGEGKIANIEVTGFADSIVARSGAAHFTSKSTLGRQIYVSCDAHGAVGDDAVAHKADAHVGERAFYGLVFKNCHQFSHNCVDSAAGRHDAWSLADLMPDVADGHWERTLRALKKAARRRLGASKWRLWDWNADTGQAPPPEPDWEAIDEHFRHLVLDAAGIDAIRAELAEARDYEAELADEAIPPRLRERLAAFRATLSDIDNTCDKAQDFLASCPGAGLSYADLKAADEDFAALAALLANNVRIRELAHKLGRDHISEDKKKQTRIPRASRNEVHGTHRSDDLMRMLPSELLNLEDETLEALFYARLLEKNLLSYELRGHDLVDSEHTDISARRTGPVVACLDTSGSMQGAALRKAKALLLAIANLLHSENRSLHVLLFGDAGQLHEISMTGASGIPALLRFLRQGFGGGTDVETPLTRAFDIIAAQGAYRKADVLMLSDGDCQVSDAFLATVKARKRDLDCTVYSVLCAGARIEDNFSDAIVVL